MMAWSDLLTALALVIIIEGLSPSISPDLFRQTMKTISSFPDGVLRAGGGVLILSGLVLLYIVRQS